METIILLTGCIRPNGMSFTMLTDANERQEQYVHAIRYYLKETNCKIIFCENSNTDISTLFETDRNKERLEFLTFCGNQDKQRGKGYGEAEIIEYALHHSTFIQDDCCITKITGRLIINNIRPIVDSFKHKYDFVTCLFHSDLKFSDSRIFCATPPFYRELLNNKSMINDNEEVFFEHVLCFSVLNSSIRYIPFTEEPMITGISGTTGESYVAQQTDIKHQLHYKCYSLTQQLEINKRKHHWRYNIYNICQDVLTQINIWKYKLLLKGK